MAEFFTDVTDRIATKVPTATTRWRSAGTTPIGSSPGGGWRTTSASPSATGTLRLGRLRHLRRRHARPAVASDVRPGADPMDAARQKMDAAFEFFAKLGVPFYCFHDRDIAPGGRDVQGVGGATRRDGRRSPPSTSSAPACGCCGARPTCSPTRATRPARPPTPTQRCSPTPPARSHTASRPPTASAATTTCCGAAARATRRCSTPTCGASSTSSPGSCTMVVEHKQRIGFTGTILHRAQAVRADQAPVRLRRRRGARLPAALRPRRRDQGQHRGQPRHLVRPRLRPRGRRPRSTPGSSARSTPTPAMTVWAGTSTASRCRWSR